MTTKHNGVSKLAHWRISMLQVALHLDTTCLSCFSFSQCRSSNQLSASVNRCCVAKQTSTRPGSVFAKFCTLAPPATYFHWSKIERHQSTWMKWNISYDPQHFFFFLHWLTLTFICRRRNHKWCKKNKKTTVITSICKNKFMLQVRVRLLYVRKRCEVKKKTAFCLNLLHFTFTALHLWIL